MTLTYGKTFGRTTPAAATNDAEPRIPAKFWLNVGYQIEVSLDDGSKELRFVSLPVGIALDTQKDIVAKGQNDAFLMFQQARNELRAQFIEVAETLKPGEERIISTDPTTGLCLQLRRVNDEKAVTAPGANPFHRKLSLVAA